MIKIDLIKLTSNCNFNQPHNAFTTNSLRNLPDTPARTSFYFHFCGFSVFSLKAAHRNLSFFAKTIFVQPLAFFHSYSLPIIKRNGRWNCAMFLFRPFCNNHRLGFCWKSSAVLRPQNGSRNFHKYEWPRHKITHEVNEHVWSGALNVKSSYHEGANNWCGLTVKSWKCFRLRNCFNRSC